MAIIIRELQTQSQAQSRVVVEHGGRRLTANVAGTPEQVRSALGTELLVEIDYGFVHGSRVLDSDRPSEHGLYAEPSGFVRVVGMIHNVVDISDTEAVVDIYLQTGPEFLCVKASELDSRPEIGDGLEVVLEDLCFHPTSWASSTPPGDERQARGAGQQGDGD